MDRAIRPARRQSVSRRCDAEPLGPSALLLLDTLTHPDGPFPGFRARFLPYRRTIPGHPRGMLSRRSSGDDPRLRHLRKRTSFPPSWLHGRDGASSIRSCHRISHSLAYVLRYGARSRSLLAAPRCPVGERFVLLWGEPGTRGPRQISKDLCTGGTNSCPTKQ